MDQVYNNEQDQSAAISSSFANLREEQKSPAAYQNPFSQFENNAALFNNNHSSMSVPQSQRKNTGVFNATNGSAMHFDGTHGGSNSIFSGRNLMKSFHLRHKSLNRQDFASQQMFGMNVNNNQAEGKSQRGSIPKNIIFESSLSRGQLFKFGESNIHNLLMSARGKRDSKVSSAQNSSRFNSHRLSHKGDPVCRICLEKFTQDMLKPEALALQESTLCTPCSCAGSIKFIHKECLKKWIQQRKSIECELCHSGYSQEWVKWATDNGFRINPNDPTQFELQVRQFNQRYKFSKFGILIVIILLALALTVQSFSSYMDIDIRLIRAFLLIDLIALIIILTMWRHFLVKMTEELIKDQVQINMSILPIDSASLIQEIEKYKGGSVSNLFINDLIERRMVWKSQPTVTGNSSVSMQTYNQVPANSVYSLATNSRNNGNSQFQHYSAETFGDVNKLTMITNEEVHDIFAEEDVPKFHQFRDEEDNESQINSNQQNSKTNQINAAGVIPPVRKNNSNNNTNSTKKYIL